MSHIICPEFWTNCWPKEYFCHNIKRMSSLYKECITKPFENPEKSADAIKEKVLQNPSEYLGDTLDGDYGSIAEEYAFCEYGIIKDMQYRTRLLWICCIFEMWEQNLSCHILQDLCNSQFPITENQKNNLFNGFDTFKHLFSSEMFDGTDDKCILTDFPKYKELQELHLLVNAIKHGRGSSLERLYKYFEKYNAGKEKVFKLYDGATLYTPTLNITDDDFCRFCNVLTDFWDWIPVHIVITNIGAFQEKVLNRKHRRSGQNEV